MSASVPSTPPADGVSYKEAMVIAREERNAKLGGLGAEIVKAYEALKAAEKACKADKGCLILRDRRLAAQRLYTKLLNDRKVIERIH